MSMILEYSIILFTYHLKGRLLAWVRSCSLRAFLQLNSLAQLSILHLKNMVVDKIRLTFEYYLDSLSTLLGVKSLMF
jgi:hypothetical protein